ncbi:glucose-6-phosphate dehydrogenase [Candidatus Microgenomates bacterium]|nr:glucose-6-phosphate dehydrogenase [Candidatus Microgenomates bacterium]
MSNNNKVKNIPTVLVIFGATGDLVEKKIAPALFNLYSKNHLPDLFSVIGFSRKKLSDEDFRKRIFQAVTKKLIPLNNDLQPFLKSFFYHQGNFENENDYLKLAQRLGQVDKKWSACSNKLFYLAVPPRYYEEILRKIKSTDLAAPCSPEEGWTRILVEKPFGKDLETARMLDNLLCELFKEEQIYPIDHYLAKEMLQNILIFRFSNNLFEESWDNGSIEKIYIRLWEKIGVENRGEFYDGVGALRDVGQNHLLQMLALATMNQPETLQGGPIRRKRAEILRTLVEPTDEEIKAYTYRAQYEGYKKIKGVGSNSNTETFFNIRAFLSSRRWRGVPITMESGKRMHEQRKELVLTFKHRSPCFCPKDGPHLKNKIIFSIEPEEGINIKFWSRIPGFKHDIEERSLDFLFRSVNQRVQYVEEYERLLLDCFEGDQTLFASSDEVQSMWKFIDPIIRVWQNNEVPLKTYPPDTSFAHEDSRYIKDGPFFNPSFKKEVGILGLGKMGANIARRLVEKQWKVVGYNRSPEKTHALEGEQIIGSYSLKDFVKTLTTPRLVWLMLPAGKTVDEIIFSQGGLTQLLDKNDIIIESGNSYYKDTIQRAKKLKKLGIRFVDVGFSGGPEGARNGACLMVGGNKELYNELKPLYFDLAKEGGLQFFNGAGAGHFVKMIHNGIEYGMMQAIAEGFSILNQSPYHLDLSDIAEVYNHGSVIQSRLIRWLEKAFNLHGDHLDDVSSTVGHTGEAQWTITTASELGTEAKVIAEAVKFRLESENKPSFAGKILSALREQFGQHKI